MTKATFTLSAFGDEIADDLHEQVNLLRALNIGYLELRGAWGKNLLEMDDDDIASIRRICDESGITVSCIGSPVGKSPIVESLAREETNLARTFEIAEAVGTRMVRVFSFYPPDTSSNVGYDDYVEEATERLARLTDVAREEGYVLFLENEKGIVGDTPDRCQAILNNIDSPHLRFAWDPSNFVQVNTERAMEQAWSSLGSFVAHVHVKDSRLADRSICAAGEGDGQVPELLIALRDCGYQGFLALEPHLAIAGHSSGFSGVSGMTHAVNTLRKLMASLGCVEQEIGG